MKTIGYIRVSTDEQATTGVSLDAQRQKLKEYASLYDLELVGIIEDAGQSAKSLNRPGLQQALTALRGDVECMLVMKLDRLTRSVVDLNTLITEFFHEKSKHQKVLMSVSDKIDTATAGGRLVLNVLMSVAQWEREAISERTTAALQHKKANGQVYGKTPYGYDRFGDELRINPSEMEVIGFMRAWRDQGFGPEKIAGMLNRAGTPAKLGGKWYPMTVQRILGG